MILVLAFFLKFSTSPAMSTKLHSATGREILTGMQQESSTLWPIHW